MLFASTALGVGSIIRNNKQARAKIIIANIEKFKQETGIYPATIDQIRIGNKIKGFSYRPYDSLHQFRIEYLIDGIDRQDYDSKTKTWGTLGWND